MYIKLLCYMYIYVETSTSFKTPEYFKGLISSALRPNPFKYIGEIVSIKDLGKLNIESVDRPNTFNNEMPGIIRCV